ncbi:MAG: helix-turn-helix transcriptional regulator [Lentisphaerae bacterium]|nr:helix-turn-helix transcriptional regulator [Lentisphaerota bacterium]
MSQPRFRLPDILAVREDRQQVTGRKQALQLACRDSASRSDILSCYLAGGPRYRLNRHTFKFRAPVAILIPAGTLDFDLQVGTIRGIYVLFQGHGLIKPKTKYGSTVVIAWGKQSLEVPMLKAVSTAQALLIEALLREIAQVRGTDLVSQMRRTTLLFRAIAEYGAMETFSPAGSIHREAARLKELIEKWAFNDRALEELYTELAVSAAHATLLFKKAFGVTPVAYRLQLRMQRARKLLVSSPLTVGMVAQAVGFADPLYFSRVFHNAFGVAPSDLIRDFARRRGTK